ncbi:hypothetical protein V8J82_03420 [Gymnodinialimonas sp. 2305UL16-5]|uniref:hypothetical protein n=1 Tax=Gymnodinialimonas mytili TaxID=3126503 RepID=UPI0030A20B6C
MRLRQRAQHVFGALALSGWSALGCCPVAAEAMTACAAEQEARGSIGACAAACIAEDPGAIALRAGPCLAAEADFWAQAASSAMADLQRVLDSETLALVEQGAAAFEGYRDAICAAESAAWPGMTGAGEAWAECRMQVTAQHALRLESWLEALE